MNPGDKVIYRQTLRGGYGYEVDVPAVFVRKASPRRWWIRVQLRAGGEREIAVKPSNLRPYVEPTPVEWVTPKEMP